MSQNPIRRTIMVSEVFGPTITGSRLQSHFVTGFAELKKKRPSRRTHFGGLAVTEKPGIYAIYHIASRKAYVGSASNISKRWSRHRKDLQNGTHKNKHLQAAWNKYGEHAFVFEVLELTSDLDTREQYWIDKTGCLDPKKGYNSCPIARSTRGWKRGPETAEYRQRKSLFLKGKCGCGIATP